MAAKKPLSKVPVDADFSKLIGAWYEMAAEAKRTADAETALRAAVYDKLYASDDPVRSEAGTEHFEMPGGWVLKVERRINCRIDRAALDVASKQVAALEADPETGEVPSLDSVLTWSPKLSDSGYREAHPEVKKILAENHVLDFAPGTPGIKLELPKSVQAKAKPKDEQ